MEVRGKVKMVSDEIQVTTSFKKRELVVTTDEQYPQHILIEFAQDKCDLLNGLQLSQEVVVNINLRGREWVNPQGETRYFNQIQGWRVEKLNIQSPQPHNSDHPTNIPPLGQDEPQPFDSNIDEEDNDGLPF